LGESILFDSINNLEQDIFCIKRYPGDSMAETLLDKVKMGFPSTIDFPPILSQLCEWDENENQGDTISGYFELQQYGRDILSRLIDKDNIRDRFGLFGLNSDGGLYCVWLQDNGKQPVVYIGSGSSARVLTQNIEDFLLLLAIGYDEVGRADFSQPPESESSVNTNFQDWVKQRLNSSIPETGEAIVNLAIEKSDDLGDWLKANCKWG
jgi:hypothetical protein